MNQIIDELSKIRFLDSDELDPKSFFIRFKNYYKEHPRHKYSEISKVVYKFNDDRIDILRINLSEIQEFANNSNELEIAKKIEKLIDHADLAEQQRKLIEDGFKKSMVLMKGLKTSLETTKNDLIDTKKETQEVQKESRETLEEFQKNYEATKREIESFKDTIYTNFITIIGIFSAIVFGTFGGIEILGTIMADMNGTRLSKLLLVSSLLIIAIITMLYLMLNAIANITGKTIRSCGCKNNTVCRHNFYKRHPIYAGTVTIGLFMFFISLIALAFDHSDFRGINIIDKTLSAGSSLFIIGVTMFVLLLLFIKVMYNRKETRGKS